MTPEQQVWWTQVVAEHDIFRLLRERREAACHQLHYLQMVTEKLAKAYHWRTGTPPPLRHGMFISFLRMLGNRDHAASARMARLLGFGSAPALRQWAHGIEPLADQIESLAPAIANDGENPEYPWPPTAPRHAPVTHKFRLADELATPRGKQFLAVLERLVNTFPRYA